MTLGTIPGATEVRYGDIRDRERADGTHWLQPELKAFFNTKLEESNETISNGKKLEYKLKNAWLAGCTISSRAVAKVKRTMNKKE